MPINDRLLADQLLGLSPKLTAGFGHHEALRERAIEEEIVRARTEWGELERGFVDAQRDGRSVVRFLQGRGCRDYAVRRWIVHELENGMDGGPDPRTPAPV